MYEETLPSRLWRYLKLGLLGYAVYAVASIIAPAYVQAWKTHKLISQIAQEQSGATSPSMPELRRTFADRAPAAGAYPDAEIDVVRESGKLVLLATYTAERRFAKCCHLQFDFDLASDRAPFRPASSGASL